MPEIISQRDALAKGAKRYFTGRTCKHGHLSERYCSTGGCIACLEQHMDKWRHNPFTRQLMQWKPGQHRVYWVPQTLTAEHSQALEAYLVQCMQHWVAHSGLETPEIADAYAKHAEARARNPALA